MKNFILLFAACFSLQALAQTQSQYAAGTTVATIVVPRERVDVTYVAGGSDLSTSTIGVFSPVAVYSLTAAAAINTNVVAIANTGTAVASGDKVVILYEDGSTQYTTVSSSNTTTVTLAANLTKAATTLTRLVELGQIGRAPLGNATVAYSGEPLFGALRGPLVIQTTATSNCWVTVTHKPMRE